MILRGVLREGWGVGFKLLQFIVLMREATKKLFFFNGPAFELSGNIFRKFSKKFFL